MRRLLLLTVAACMTLLVACGGPAGPAIPQATSVTPSTAARGATITIAGSGFGTTPGAVKVGGVAATVTDWTASSITATVPAGTPNAWQDVSVTTPGGTDTVEDLFVGVEFGGTGPELQAFLDGLELGTAVLLQAANYDVSAQITPFLIDNVDLYGRGQAQTTITQPTTAPTVVFANFGSVTTLADLTLAGDNMSFLHGTVSDTVLPVSVPAGQALPTDLESLRSMLASIPHGQVLLPAAAYNPRVVLERISFTETAAGMWGTVALSLPKVDLTISHSTIDAPTSLVGLVVGGDVLVESSTITALQVQLASLTGSLDIVDSDVGATESSMLGAESGLTIADSELRVADGNIVFFGAVMSLMGGATVPTGGAIEISGSTIEALDADLLDATDIGQITMVTQFAPITLAGNVLLRSHDDFDVMILDSQTGEGDVELRGNLDVRVGVFEAESVAGARPATLLLLPTSNGLRNRISLEGNTIAVTQSLQVHEGGTAANLFATGNVISAGDGSIVGLVTLGAMGEGTVEVTDNQVDVSGSLQLLANNLVGGTLAVTGNQFTNTGDGPGMLTIQAVDGSCELSNNSIDFDDPSDANSSNVVVMCDAGTPSDTFAVSGNDIRATGAVGSLVILATPSGGTVAVSENHFHTGAAVQLLVPAATVTFVDNTGELEGGGTVAVAGDTGSTLTATGNVFTIKEPQQYGVALSGLDEVTFTGNSFTGVGTPGAAATALHVSTSASPVTITATGNTFTNFTNALWFQDAAANAHGITANINDNVFDFTIDAAPKVATLFNVKDAINASNNQWGSNTVLGTVQGYVALAGDTGVQGGSIVLSPLKLP